MEVKVSQRQFSILVLHGMKSSITYQNATHEEECIHPKVHIPDRLPNKLFDAGKGIIWIRWNRKKNQYTCYIVTCAGHDARIDC